MKNIQHLAGITAQTIHTERLNMHVLTAGPQEGIPVIFLHGNFTAATWWEEIMISLPGNFRAVAPDMRGYGLTEDKRIDATRGMGDWSDDLDALILALGIAEAHLVGWSLGGGVLYRYIIDHPQKILSATLLAPVSPYGFGGTKDVKGTPCFDDFAGSGGGVVNPEFVRRIIAEDRSSENPNSPRNVIDNFYYKPPFRASREEDLLTAALMEKMGDDRYPGDSVPSANWPGIAPGIWGPINAGAPKYALDDAAALIATEPKPPLLWIHGGDDQIVSDNSMFDLGALGKLGFVPGWPGDDVYPPQPMIAQTRDVLEQYQAHGGRFEEHVIADAAHAVHIEKPEEFMELLIVFLEEQ
jgi:pimeloyl-ACP methyl ester carboxylesterase